MRVPVYLADLRYNYSGVLANDCMPLGVACMKAVMDRDLPDADARLFVYADRLTDAITKNPPAVRVKVMANATYQSGHTGYPTGGCAGFSLA